MVTIEKISKTYQKGAIKAVKETSFEVKTGEIFGLIGPDGAGKTSILRMVATLLLPDRGTIHIDGLEVRKDYAAIRTLIGYMPGKFSLYPDLTVEENLHFFAAMFATDIEQNYALIKPIYDQLAPFKQRRAAKLSGGMKQKLALCCALIHRPKLLILDEPTTGVDPVSRKEFWAMLGELKSQGLTVVVSTPYMDEALQCDRIALMSAAEVLRIHTPAEIIASYPDRILAIQADSTSRLLTALKTYPDRINSYGFGQYTHLVLPKASTASDNLSIKNWLEGKGLQQVEVLPATVTVEDCFIRLLS